MIVDAQQALADRRSTNIADLVLFQIQCLQGGIVPVRVHTPHGWMIKHADKMLPPITPTQAQVTDPNHLDR
jgi:hypothetical protein